MKLKTTLLILTSLGFVSVASAQSPATVPSARTATGRTDIPTAPSVNTAPSSTGTTAIPPESSGAIQDQTTGTYLSPNAPSVNDTNRQIPKSKRTSKNTNGTLDTNDNRNNNSNQNQNMNNSNPTYPETDRQ